MSVAPPMKTDHHLHDVPEFVPDHLIATMVTNVAGRALSGSKERLVQPATVANAVLGDLLPEEEEICRKSGCSVIPKFVLHPLEEVEVDSLERVAEIWDGDVDFAGLDDDWSLNLRGLHMAIQGVLDKMEVEGEKEENFEDGLVLVLWERAWSRIRACLEPLGWRHAGGSRIVGRGQDLFGRIPVEWRRKILRSEAGKFARCQWARLRGVLGCVLQEVRWTIVDRMEALYRESRLEVEQRGGDLEEVARVYVGKLDPVHAVPGSRMFRVEGVSSFGDKSDGEILEEWGARAGLLATGPLSRKPQMVKGIAPEKWDVATGDWMGLDLAACMLVLQTLQGVAGRAVANKAKACADFVRNPVMHDRVLSEALIESKQDPYHDEKRNQERKGIRWMLTDLLVELIKGIETFPECLERRKGLEQLLEPMEADRDGRCWKLRIPDATSVDPDTGLVLATSGPQYERVMHRRLQGQASRWFFNLEPWERLTVGDGDVPVLVQAPPGRKRDAKDVFRFLFRGEDREGSGVPVAVFCGIGGMGKSTLSRHVAKKAFVDGDARHVIWIDAENEDAAQRSFLNAVQDLIKWESDGWPREQVLKLQEAEQLFIGRQKTARAPASARPIAPDSTSGSETETECDPWAPARALASSLRHLPGVVLVILDNLDPWGTGDKGWVEKPECQAELGNFFRDVCGDTGRTRVLVSTRFDEEDERLARAIAGLVGAEQRVLTKCIDEIEDVEGRVAILELHCGRNLRDDRSGRAVWELVGDGQLGGRPLELALAGQSIARVGLEEYVEKATEQRFLNPKYGELVDLIERETELAGEAVDGFRKGDGVKIARAKNHSEKELKRLTAEDVVAIVGDGVDADALAHEIKSMWDVPRLRRKVRTLRREAKSGRERSGAVVDLSLRSIGIDEQERARYILRLLSFLPAGVRIREGFLDTVFNLCRERVRNDVFLSWEGCCFVTDIGNDVMSRDERRLVLTEGFRNTQITRIRDMPRIWEVVQRIWGHPVANDVRRFAESIGSVQARDMVRILHSVGLVSQHACDGDCEVSVHRVIREQMQRGMDAVGLESLALTGVYYGVLMKGPEATEPLAADAFGGPRLAAAVLESCERRSLLRRHIQAWLGRWEHARGHSMTAKEYVEQVLALEEHLVGKESQLYAASSHMLASIFRGLGDMDSAGRKNQESLDISRRIDGEHSNDFAGSLHQLALLRQERGEFDAALSLYRESLDITEKAIGRNTIEYANTLFNIGSVLHAVGRLDDAFRTQVEACEIVNRVIGKETVEYASMRMTMAASGFSRQSAEADVTQAEEAREILGRVVGKDSKIYLNALQNSVMLLTRSGRLDKVHALLHEMKVGGSDQNHNTLWLQAALATAQGNTLEARRRAEEAIQKSKTEVGARSHSHATLLITLACPYIDSARDTIGRMVTGRQSIEETMDEDFDRVYAMVIEALDIFEELSMEESQEYRASILLKSLLDACHGISLESLESPESLESLEATCTAVEGFGRVEGASELRLSIASLHFRRGSYDLAMSNCQRGIATLERAGKMESSKTCNFLSLMVSIEIARGHFGEARALSDSLLATLDRTGKQNSIDFVRALKTRGDMELKQGKSDLGVRFLEPCARISKTLSNVDSRELSSVVSSLAVAKQKCGQLDEALALFEEACALIRARPGGVDAEEFGIVLGNLGVVHEDRKDLDSAESTYAESLRVLERAVGRKTIACANKLKKLGEIKVLRNDFESGKVLLSESKSIFEELEETETDSYVSILSTLSDCELQNGRPSVAMAHTEEALRVEALVNGKDTEIFATLLSCRASDLAMDGNVGLAVDVFRECCDTWARLGKRESEQYCVSMEKLAECQLSLGREEDARGSWMEAKTVLERLNLQESVRYATVLYGLGTIDYNRKRFDVALRAYRRALDIANRIDGEEYLRGQILHNLAQLEKARGNFGEAWSWFQDSLQALQRAGKSRDHVRASCLHSMAGIEMSRGNLDSAWSMYTEALEIKRGTTGPETMDFARSLFDMALLEQQRSNYARSFELFDEVRQIFERLEGPVSKEYAATLKQLVAVAIALERFADARRYLDRHDEISRTISLPADPQIELFRFTLQMAELLPGHPRPEPSHPNEKKPKGKKKGKKGRKKK